MTMPEVNANGLNMRRTSFARIAFLCLCLVFSFSLADDKTCSQDDATCQAEDCLSQVKLFQGIPSTLTGKPQEVTTTTLLDDEPARFEMVARFSEEFEALDFSLDERLFHISANGNHEGWFVRVRTDLCWNVAKRLVAREIVALADIRFEQIRQVDLRGPHRLVDEKGKPYPEETTSQRLHLLLPREAFIHESVEEGFVRTLDDGITLKTLSMSPRVFVVDPILSVERCEAMIEASSSSFRRSEEKHYGPGYDNYRTSLTGRTPQNCDAAQELHHRVRDITAMPEGGVEFPQLLKYETGTSWYKSHLDYFHNFESRPVEEFRLFVRVRAQELLRLNVTDITSVLNKGPDPLLMFDHPNRLLRRTIVTKLAESLNLSTPQGMNVRRVLHQYMVHSREPLAVFEKVCLLFAEQLLEENGASESRKLAYRYFRLQQPTHPDINDYIPYALKPIESNRHATVLPILREAVQGGYTAFPNSQSKLGLDPDPDEEIKECKQGLIVKPQAGQALLFYNRLPRGDKDPNSRHAGCPPKEGEKFAANCFTWDSDQHWAWRFMTDIGELYDRP